MCPDYYLICSGKVLCNDIFDCVIKKSEIKEESYFPDYQSKTSQNLIRIENEEIDNENNYELSIDGICPQYCKQCSDNKRCIKCRNDYVLFRNKNNSEIICISEDEVRVGYYMDNNTSIYNKCGSYCEKCLNDINCLKCEDNYTKIDNINISCYLINELIPYYAQDPNDEFNFINCSIIFNNCLTCNEYQCLSCFDDYYFFENNFNECILYITPYYTEEYIEETSIENYEQEYSEELEEINESKDIEYSEEISEEYESEIEVTDTEKKTYNYIEVNSTEIIGNNNITYSYITLTSTYPFHDSTKISNTAITYGGMYTIFILQATYADNILNIYIISDPKIEKSIKLSLKVIIAESTQEGDIVR